MEGSLIRGVATIEVVPALVGDQLDRPSQAGLPLPGQPCMVADPLERGADVGTCVGDHPIDRGGRCVARPLLVG